MGAHSVTTTSLYARLAPLAALVRLHPTRRLVGHPAGDCETPQEYQALSESLTFEAFIQLGGDPEAPDQFDWSRAQELVRVARRQLRAQLTRRSTNYGEYCARSQPRRRLWIVPRYTAAPGDTHQPLLDKLEKILTPREYWVFVEWAVYDTPLLELAKYLIQQHPTQFGGQVARAAKAVAATKRRALRKIRRLRLQ